jgi:hypothetical protein
VAGIAVGRDPSEGLDVIVEDGGCTHALEVYNIEGPAYIVASYRKVRGPTRRGARPRGQGRVGGPGSPASPRPRRWPRG